MRFTPRSARRLLRRRDDRGSAAIDMLLLAGVVVSMIVVVVAAGRYTDGPAQANDAAYAAARAASLQLTLEQGIAAGRQAATESLAERGKSCVRLSVSFAGSDFTPGGQVVAEIECTASLVDTGVIGKALGLRPTQAFTERAVVPIEQYRSGS